MDVRGGALLRNLQRIREAVGPDAALIPMVKADAYGLGMPQAVRALRPAKPWGWGVATVEEGALLREMEPERPILVVAPVAPDSVPAGVAARLSFGISDVSFLSRVAREAERQDRDVAVHLEVDTGMGRAGFDWRTVREWGPRVAELMGGRVRCEGAFTHFHSADLEGAESVKVQAERFGDAVSALPKGAGAAMLHLCNSAAALRTPELAQGGVRPGIFLYGGRPGEGLPEPEEVLAVRARITLVRQVPPGTTVGYGATYRAGGWERWATVAIGYGDGIRRALSNRGEALVAGRRVPIVGRISMDMTVVEITDVPGIEPGDTVTFLGSDGGETITLEEMARHLGTNNYEVLTGFTPRLPRVWQDAEGPHPQSSVDREPDQRPDITQDHMDPDGD